MAKLPSASCEIMKVASRRANFSLSIRLGKHKPQSYALSRKVFLGEVSRKGTLLTSHNARVGKNTFLAKPASATKDDWGGPEAENTILHFKDDIIEAMKVYDSLLVFFYTTWCVHCKSMKIVFGQAALKMKKDGISGHLGAVDITKRMDIADMFDIVAVPLLRYFRNGEVIAKYNAKRTVDDLVNFMKNPPTKQKTLPKIDI